MSDCNVCLSDTESIELVQGLYGSEFDKSKACGYCRHHHKYLTVKQVKQHNCLGKQCWHLHKHEEHDWWRQREVIKQRRKERQMVHMIFNQPGDWSEILYYEGDYYSNGTEVMVSDEYINTHMFNGKKIWKYARFADKIICNGQISYFFWASRQTRLDFNILGIDYATCNDYSPYFIVTAWALPSMIQEFTRPIKMPEQRKEAINQAIMDMIEHPKRDWDYPELLIGWIIYICAMIGSLMFREFYIPWIIASYVFYEYRKGVLSQ